MTTTTTPLTHTTTKAPLGFVTSLLLAVAAIALCTVVLGTVWS